VRKCTSYAKNQYTYKGMHGHNFTSVTVITVIPFKKPKVDWPIFFVVFKNIIMKRNMSEFTIYYKTKT
jgi:hypothetical protein